MSSVGVWFATMIFMFVLLFFSFGIGVALVVWFIKKFFSRK